MTGKYEKMKLTEKYGVEIYEDKSVDKLEEVGGQLFKLFSEGDYTRTEIANLTGIPIWKLNRIFAGDEDFSIYEITHIAGVLGYDFQIVFPKAYDGSKE